MRERALRQPELAYQPETAADTLSERLEGRILIGAFAPGEVLSARRVALAEGVSVIPARDALRALVAKGALVFRDSRTIAVPNLSADALSEIALARVAVEGALAERAFERLGTQIPALAQIDAEVTAALKAGDAQGYMRCNTALHFAIYDRADAPILHGIARGLWLRFAPSMRIVCAQFRGALPRDDHHVRALRALKAQDRAAFRNAIEDDIAQGMQILIEHAETRDVPRAPK